MKKLLLFIFAFYLLQSTFSQGLIQGPIWIAKNLTYANCQQSDQSRNTVCVARPPATAQWHPLQPSGRDSSSLNKGIKTEISIKQ